jgi:hypothetical protein
VDSSQHSREHTFYWMPREVTIGVLDAEMPMLSSKAMAFSLRADLQRPLLAQRLVPDTS